MWWAFGLLVVAPGVLSRAGGGPEKASKASIFDLAGEVAGGGEEEEGGLLHFIRQYKAAKNNSLPETPDPKLFDYVRVDQTSSHLFGDATPIDGLVARGLRVAVDEVFRANPGRTFLVAKGPGERLTLVGSGEEGAGKRVEYRYREEEGKFVSVMEEEEVGPAAEAGAEFVWKHRDKGEDDEKASDFDETELEFWKSHGHLGEKSEEAAPQEKPRPEFAPELVEDLGGVSPHDPASAGLVIRFGRDKREADEDGGVEMVPAEGRSHPYQFEGGQPEGQQGGDEDGDAQVESSEELDKSARDLIYEAMKMRTGHNQSRDKNAVRPVGGGILEKKLLEELVAAEGESPSGGGEGPAAAAADGREASQLLHRLGGAAGGGLGMASSLLRVESREMQCCHDLELTSTGGAAECHPYALGAYRKIGVCGGRSFYQNEASPDIFLYYACGGWYVGLEVGSCGGWIVSKSLELCVSGQHLTPWTYFDEGRSEEDPTFAVRERCKFYNDFRPLPPGMAVGAPPGSSHQQQQLPPINYPGQPVYQPSHHQDSRPGGSAEKDGSVKHEHYHYHIKVSDDAKDAAATSGLYKPVSGLPASPSLDPSQDLMNRHDLLHRLGSGNAYHGVGGGHVGHPAGSLPGGQPLLPGDQAVAFDFGSDDIALRRPGSPGPPLSVKGVFEGHPQQHYQTAAQADQGYHQTYIDGSPVKKPGRQQIMINNFHLPQKTSTTTSPPTTTTATTTTTTPKPLSVVVVQRPSSDLQHYRQQPMAVRDKINQDLITLQYVRGGAGGVHQQAVAAPAEQSTPLVGYIIKKRRPPSRFEPPEPSDVYSLYGRSEHQMEEGGGGHDGGRDHSGERTYFPLGREAPKEDEEEVKYVRMKTLEEQQNSRKMR